jgi:hypothetical protein
MSPEIADINVQNWETLADDLDYQLRRAINGDEIIITKTPSHTDETQDIRVVSYLDLHHLLRIQHNPDGGWLTVQNTEPLALDIFDYLRNQQSEAISCTIDGYQVYVNYVGETYRLLFTKYVEP